MKKNKKNGFGIIEVLVATLLIVVISGSAIGLGRSLLRNNELSGLRVQAYNLAREGLEIARSRRDTTWINLSWDEWDEDFCTQEQQCYFEIDENGDLIPTEGSEQIETDEGVIFERSYEFIELPETTDISDLVSESPVSGDIYSQTRRVIVTVSFNYADKDYSVQLNSLLTNWKPQL